MSQWSLFHPFSQGLQCIVFLSYLCTNPALYAPQFPVRDFSCFDCCSPRFCGVSHPIPLLVPLGHLAFGLLAPNTKEGPSRPGVLGLLQTTPVSWATSSHLTADTWHRMRTPPPPFSEYGSHGGQVEWGTGLVWFVFCTGNSFLSEV